jgi:glucose-6-phosphate 1-dehydrogenase
MSAEENQKGEKPAARRPDAVPEPFILVIFGASGDLTKRKLIPAVHSLFRQGLLPEKFSVVGFARRPQTDAGFAEAMRESIESFAPETIAGEAKGLWAKFAARLFYHRGEFHELKDYQALRERLEQMAKKDGVQDNYIFYLATQPDFFGLIAEKLREAGLARANEHGSPWSRLIIEKPFGHDLASARELNRFLQGAFAERQLFRIDHYLGKEAVQNILVFRFANSIFEPIWNQKYVDHVQITMGEEIGVEERGAYYDHMGALRDMVQNHMMNLLCFVAMESPMNVSSRAVRDEKVKVLQSLRPIPSVCAVNGVVRAQYSAGICGGKPVPGYRQEPGVAPDSQTETFVAFKANVDNWRWAGVPFYLRTGKRLARRLTQISIHFKPVPQILFNADPGKPLQPNILTLRIQPDEGIFLEFQQKVPGMAMEIRPFEMQFGYGTAFGKPPPEAYERLLLDAAFGDSTLFIRNDELEAAWAYVEPIIAGCSGALGGVLPTYPAGTWGPKQADDLIRADGREWAPTDVPPSELPAGEPEGERSAQLAYGATGNA